MAVGIDEDAGIPAPHRGGAGPSDRGSGRARLLEDRVDLLGSSDVINERHAAPNAAVHEGRVVGEGGTAAQPEHQLAAMEEEDPGFGKLLVVPYDTLVEP